LHGIPDRGRVEMPKYWHWRRPSIIKAKNLAQSKKLSSSVRWRVADSHARMELYTNCLPGFTGFWCGYLAYMYSFKIIVKVILKASIVHEAPFFSNRMLYFQLKILHIPYMFCIFTNRIDHNDLKSISVRGGPP